MDIKRIDLEKNIKKLQESKSLGLTEVSKRARVNKSSLHNYLNGVTPQGLKNLVKLSILFKVSLDDLVFEKEQIDSKLENRRVLEDDTKLIEKYEVTIKRL